ncbi:RluA family pseudouridine synthase [Bosea sp. BIWAKO-01]|uniref:RluA family pseudouridine synthase n=1 Tax=Bosea sp. BIWAKO-01 TaxID=506668 RepID=UPI000852D6CD|nr:ribosomal large subunit pseudouridine synthase C [Bosea sp. BIWAKO-01]
MSRPDQPAISRETPEAALPVPLLYRDAMMLVIDKPAGLPSHRGPQAKRRVIPVLTDYLDALRFGLPRRPEAAHRLDKDTSGCLILGRHPRAMAELNQLFRDGRIDKTYWAIVEGAPPDEEGLIDLPLARRSPERGWWMKVDPEGLPSQTRYRVLGRAEGLTWLELEPLTGRTHQLRVHCAASGWPMLGDEVYGSAPRDGGPGLQLHARAVSVPLYRKREPIRIEAPPPSHMLEALGLCGWSKSFANPNAAAEQGEPSSTLR